MLFGRASSRRSRCMHTQEASAPLTRPPPFLSSCVRASLSRGVVLSVGSLTLHCSRGQPWCAPSSLCSQSPLLPARGRPTPPLCPAAPASPSDRVSPFVTPNRISPPFTRRSATSSVGQWLGSPAPRSCSSMNSSRRRRTMPTLSATQPSSTSRPLLHCPRPTYASGETRTHHASVPRRKGIRPP